MIDYEFKLSRCEQKTEAKSYYNDFGMYDLHIMKCFKLGRSLQ